MIIETSNSFGELSKGECFLLANNADKRLLMKTEVVFDEKEDCYLNAVSLFRRRFSFLQCRYGSYSHSRTGVILTPNYSNLI